MRNVRQIIEDAGGPKEIAKAAKNTRWKITFKSVYDWPQIGIPDRHWPVLIKLAKATAEELMEANKKARARPRRSPVRVAEEAEAA